MQDAADMELLHLYSHRNSEDSFAALVARHINLVYSTALRKTGSPDAAEEVTQAVFVVLAKKARGLRSSTILSGWLYQTARLTASSFLRTERRRRQREQEACMESLSTEAESEAWTQILPLLDDALGSLGEKDRNAVVLRFFKGQSFQEIGLAFGATENAAKKRVAYALEKLRKFLLKRGVASTTGIIATAMSAGSLPAAPASLTASATAISLQGAGLSASMLGLVNGALQMMAWAKVKLALGLGAAAIGLAGVSGVLILSERNTAAPGFGALIERVVNSDVPRSVPTGRIDFDTGKQLPMPASAGNTGGSQLLWQRSQGIDAESQILGWRDAAGRSRTTPGMLCFDMTVAPVTADAWETFTPAAVRETLVSAPPQSLSHFSNGATSTLSFMGSGGELPLTYLFKTREGAAGILQITAHTTRPRGVKFRYRLVKPERKENSS